jgi:hypothetical protein
LDTEFFWMGIFWDQVLSLCMWKRNRDTWWAMTPRILGLTSDVRLLAYSDSESASPDLVIYELMITLYAPLRS